MGIRKVLSALLIAAALFTAGSSAWAKDAVVAGVTAISPANPIIVQNGNPYSQGTYAIGTIQLFYPVAAYQFTAGNFGSFQLDLSIKQGTSNPATQYPATLNLKQTGSANLELDPAIDSFLVTGPAWTGSTTVDINIPQSVALDPAFQVDGAELVANLQLVVPDRRFLDTVTTIQVHLILMHPSACLKVLNFVTDNGINNQINSIDVSKNSNNNRVSSSPTEPHYIVVVANTCSVDQCIDARFTIDSDFQLKSGQPVKTFSSSSIIEGFQDVGTFLASGPTADPQGTATCLTVANSCIQIPAGDSFLIKADFVIKNSATFPPPAQYTGFGARILNGGSTNNCADPGTLNSVADPNPISATLNAHCVDGSGKVSCP